MEQQDIFPIEQKGCRNGSYGTKDQLLINKMILENAHSKHRNLSTAWIDYKKALDSVPHAWIMRSLDLFGISLVLIQFLKSCMSLWDQCLPTRSYRLRIIKDGTNPMCRLCGKFEETIEHITDGCHTLAVKEYIHRHYRLAAYVHYKILQHYNIQVGDDW